MTIILIVLLTFLSTCYNFTASSNLLIVYPLQHIGLIIPHHNYTYVESSLYQCKGVLIFAVCSYWSKLQVTRGARCSVLETFHIRVYLQVSKYYQTTLPQRSYTTDQDIFLYENGLKWISCLQQNGQTWMTL